MLADLPNQPTPGSISEALASFERSGEHVLMGAR
jgi:hypothetical protein